MFAHLAVLELMQALLDSVAAQVVGQENFLELVPLHVLLALQVQNQILQSHPALPALQARPALAELRALHALAQNQQLAAPPA